MNDELPWIYLWSPNSIFAVSKKLVGFKPPSYADPQHVERRRVDR